MSHPPASDLTDPAGPGIPLGGYSIALKTGFQETTRRVKEIHCAIADLSIFQVLRWIPGMAGPARLAQDVHDAVVSGIYAAVRHSGGGLLAAAALLEQQVATTTPVATTPPSRLVTGLRSALNAAVGDYLADSANPLAIPMGFYAAGHQIPLTNEGLRAHVADPSDRLCVFIHGLGCDEHGWQWYADTAWDPPGQHYGARLQTDLGYTPLYLRYNTGLPITDNGRQLMRQLSALLAVWPQPVRELVLIGHSMGGLVARSACDEAAAEGLSWLEPTHMVICLGSPHRGAPLEQLGHLTTTALHLSKLTAPLGKIAAARSAGVKDLRHGLWAHEERTQAAAVASSVAYRFISANLSGDPDHPLGHILGDGLVTLGSATPPALADDVDSVRLGGLSHMALLNEPRVYAWIKQWLEASEARNRV